MFQGKTVLSDFEGRLAKFLHHDLNNKNLDNNGKLLVCVILSKFDNYDNTFEKKFACELDEDLLSKLSLPWFSNYCY